MIHVLVPVKGFREAKRRLAAALTPDARAELARAMAAQVVAAAGSLPVAVVCDDDEVASWARAARSRVLWRPGLGLNGAVNDGVATLAAEGASRVIVAHADLPLAEHLAPVADFDGVTLVPDRRDNGTNVACVPAHSGFTFTYGAGSFARHRAEAERVRRPCRVLRDPQLGWDIDVPDDLSVLPS